ncbi:MAG: hypothetical protein WD469_04865 [Paenibacillaceae bacterium]
MMLSVSLYSMTEFNQRFNLGIVDKMLLDAAHDAEAIYKLLDHQSIGYGHPDFSDRSFAPKAGL